MIVTKKKFKLQIEVIIIMEHNLPSQVVLRIIDSQESHKIHIQMEILDIDIRVNRMNKILNTNPTTITNQIHKVILSLSFYIFRQ